MLSKATQLIIRQKRTNSKLGNPNTRGILAAVTAILNQAYRVSASTRWRFAFALRCHSNATRARLQIRPIVRKYAAPPTILQSYIRVRGVVWACGRGQTDRQTRVTNIHREAEKGTIFCMYLFNTWILDSNCFFHILIKESITYNVCV